MGLRNKGIESLRGRTVLPWHVFNLGVGNAGGGAGAPAWGELSTFAYGGITVGAAGDEWSALDLETPALMDPRHTIGATVIWTVEGSGIATSDSITWAVSYDQCDVGEALTAPQKGTGAALDTTIAAQSPSATTTLRLHRSSRGIISKNKFDFTARQGAIAWNVEADALSGFSADEAVFLGLVIDYVPLWTRNEIEQTSGALTADLVAA